MSKKVYLIRGSSLDSEGKKEWIESITASKERANKISEKLKGRKFTQEWKDKISQSKKKNKEII
jgi:hypothetical protein